MLRRVSRPRLRSEPLVHFAAIGCVLFALHAVCAPRTADSLTVDAARAAATQAALTRKLARTPTPAESAAALLLELDEERLYREALALGLDEGDPIVRRRMIQKLRFVQEDLADAEPDDAALLALRDEHQGRYTAPARLAVTHVFAAHDRHADPRAAAQTFLTQLQAGADPTALGDLNVHGRSFGARPLSAYAGVFGDEFAAALSNMSEGTWSLAPSALGWHVVRVDARAPARLPDLATLRPRLRVDWDARRREAASEAAAADLRARYPILLKNIEPDLAAALAEAER
jgi:peptidyl-prolyl cis-trans isomerase C